MKNVFIHGLGQSSLSWDKTISLMAKPMEAICLELSELLDSKEATYKNLYNAFSAYCQNISEPLNLCGISLGGVLALNYTIDYPDRVQSLVLIGVPYKIPKILIQLQNNIIFRFMPNSAFKDIGFKKKDFIQLTNSMTDLDFSKKLKDISCSTLIVCGEKDSVNKKSSKIFFENILGSELKIIENSGHEVNVDQPEKLASELERFYLM